ncbi:MAG: hypothetical protein ACRD4K_08945, partial [Candidatus Acidiferrales bacterium]
YLLWAYQRVIWGEVTVEKNKLLPDASKRERMILALICLLALFMGVASPLFTRRMEATSQSLLQQMQRNRAYDARGGTSAPGPAVHATPGPAAAEALLRDSLPERRAQN